MTARIYPLSGQPFVAGSDPRERKRGFEGAPVVEIAFDPGFRDSNWCRRGHAGYVLEGTLGFELDTAPHAPSLAAAGDAFVIESGTLHRAFNPGSSAVRVFIHSWD
jgi:quercetin dioxygenase-like cupin family protein